MATYTGCSVDSFRFMHLGLPVRDNMHRIRSWDVLLEKSRKMLSKWKMRMLSIGGRLTLVKRKKRPYTVWLLNWQQFSRVTDSIASLININTQNKQKVTIL
ncbi:hypothetical protein LXL04_030496 [Taraxacum kok-saghyz]